MIPLPHRVLARRRETADTVTLDLAPVDPPSPSPAPRPGQFAMLWPFGVGEAAISYSRTHPDDVGSVGHTVRAVGPISRALAALDIGDVVGVRGPLGAGWDVADVGPGPAVVVAGGIGLAPLRPVVETLIAEATGPVALFVGARSPDQLLYEDDLERWRSAGVEVAVTVDRATPGWSGHVGVVTELFERSRWPADSRAWVCGPEIMMRFASEELVDGGVAADRIEVSLERNMQCGIGHCGHCQIGGRFVCTDGPVAPWSAAAPLISVPDR